MLLNLLLFFVFIILIAIVAYSYFAKVQKRLDTNEKSENQVLKFFQKTNPRYLTYGLAVVLTVVLIIIIPNTSFGRLITYKLFDTFPNLGRVVFQPEPPSPPANQVESYPTVFNSEISLLSIFVFLALLIPIFFVITSSFTESSYRLFLPEVTFGIALITIPITFRLNGISFGLYLGALGAILFPMLALKEFFLFPFGLAQVVLDIFGHYSSMEYTLRYLEFPIYGIWAGYILFFIIIKFMKNRISFFVLYFFLLIILATNIVGCTISVSNWLGI